MRLLMRGDRELYPRYHLLESVQLMKELLVCCLDYIYLDKCMREMAE